MGSGGTVTVTNGSAGVLTTGTVTGSHTYTLASSAYTVTVTVTDDDGGSSTVQFIVHALTSGPNKFYVVDQSAKHVFFYDAAGNPSGGFDCHLRDTRCD
jgi:hypothetical protein